MLPLYAVLFLTHALPLVGLAVAPLAGLAALAVKLAADGAVLWAVGRRVGAGLSAMALLGFEAFLIGYLVTLPVALAVRPEIDWKGRQH